MCGEWRYCVPCRSIQPACSQFSGEPEASAAVPELRQVAAHSHQLLTYVPFDFRLFSVEGIK